MQEKIPFIHLLESPNGKYFFDVNKNEIIAVSEEAYIALKKIVNQEDVVCNHNEKLEIADLESMGYLSSNKVKTIKHGATDFLELYMGRKLGKITIQLTQSCNLRCSYCVYSDDNNAKQRKHSGKKISFETAKKGIDYLLKHSIDSKEINVAFYGGEPLLEFELLTKLVNYVEQAAEGRNLSFNLTTNCTLVTREMIEYFIAHNISMSISLDGPKEVHDSNRHMANGTGSFDRLIETMQWINKDYPDYMEKVVISMVIDPKHDFDYINSVFIKYPFFKKSVLMSAVVDDTYSQEKIVYSEGYYEQQEYRLFLGLLSNFQRLDNDYISPIVNQDLAHTNYMEEKFEPFEELAKQSAPSGPCIPGQIRLFINVDGNFFPCERVSEASEIMLIGNTEDGIYLDKVEKLLNVGKLTAGKCRNCWSFTRCTLCARNADGGNELSGKMKLAYCDGVKRNFEYFLRTMILYEEYERIYT